MEEINIFDEEFEVLLSKLKKLRINHINDVINKLKRITHICYHDNLEVIRKGFIDEIKGVSM